MTTRSDREKRRALEAATAEREEAERDLVIIRELRAVGATRGPFAFAALKSVRAEVVIAELRGETPNVPRIVSDFLRRAQIPAVKRPAAPTPKTPEDAKAERDAYHARLRELGITPH